LQSPGTPAALRDSLIFEYTDGTRFVGEAYRRGGWNAVNALYRNPPLSTRQVLEPALYFGYPSPPLTITVGGWAPTLKEWHMVGENTYGELLLRIILARGPSGQAEAGLARGWRGDRMVVLEKDGALIVIWILALTRESRRQSRPAVLRRCIISSAAAAWCSRSSAQERRNRPDSRRTFGVRA
jgi:hypothetical protein